ncbi:MAG: response regulator [Planctomycetota bacterium]|jgi:PleD family two-component response regulator
MDKLLTSGDVAEVCQVSLPIVLNWVKQGLLKSYQTAGGHNRFAPQDIVDFLEKNNMYITDDLREKLSNNHYGKSIPRRVLIADDNERVRKTLYSALTAEGFKVLKAADSIRTKKKIKNSKFDIVVIDYMMPGIYIQEILALLGDNQPRLIILLDYRDAAAENELSKLGIQDVLVKPVDVDEFVGILQNNIMGSYS